MASVNTTAILNESDLITEPDTGTGFPPNSKIGKLYELLSDNQWHCATCEIQSSQPAALIRALKRLGYEVETSKKMICDKCDSRETHRRLVSNLPKKSLKFNLQTPQEIQARIERKERDLAEVDAQRAKLVKQIEELKAELQAAILPAKA